MLSCAVGSCTCRTIITAPLGGFICAPPSGPPSRPTATPRDIFRSHSKRSRKRSHWLLRSPRNHNIPDQPGAQATGRLRSRLVHAITFKGLTHDAPVLPFAELQPAVRRREDERSPVHRAVPPDGAGRGGS